MSSSLKTFIISQGRELLNGSTLDTNAQTIAKWLHQTEYSVDKVSVLPDDLIQIKNTLKENIEHYKLIIITGGLGPTADDLTAEAMGMLCEEHCLLNSQALRWLEAYFQQKNIPPPQSALKMALMPPQATALYNPLGSASGISLRYNDTTILAFPGVPEELKAMLPLHLKPLKKTKQELLFATFGYPERKIVSLLAPVDAPFGIQATPQVTWISFSTHHLEKKQREELSVQIKVLLAPILFAERRVTLEKVVSELLLQREESIALAESCTGGKLSSWLCSRAGASRYFKEAAIVYSNSAKQRYCGVLQADLDEFGAVSEPVALALAQGIAERSGSTWGIGISGIAGPGGGSQEKPVGTVHISLFGPNVQQHQRFVFSGSRAQITDKAAAAALFMLYQQIKH